MKKWSEIKKEADEHFEKIDGNWKSPFKLISGGLTTNSFLLYNDEVVGHIQKLSLNLDIRERDMSTLEVEIVGVPFYIDVDPNAVDAAVRKGQKAISITRTEAIGGNNEVRTR